MMKKKKTYSVWFFGLLILLVLLNVSCDDKLDDEKVGTLSPYPSMENINFHIDDTLMYFATIGDLEAMYIYIAELPDSLLNDFERYLNFYSLRKSCDYKETSYPIEDEFLLLTLNETRSFAISNYIIQFNFTEETVTVDGLNNYAEENLCKVYTFEDDVADILFFSGELSKKGAAATKCDTKIYAEGTFELFNADVDWQIKYYYTPFSYRVKAKMSKPAFRPGIDLFIYCGDTHMPSGYESTWMRSDELCQVGYNGFDELKTTVEVYMAISTTRLYGFRLYALFEAYDNYATPPAQTYHDTYAAAFCHTADLDNCNY